MAGDGNGDDRSEGEQKGGIPSWQRSDAPTTSQSQSKPPVAASTRTTISHGSDEQHSDSKPLIEKAQHWLQDESVRDSPTADKVAFLKSKGLSEADINTAIESTDAVSTSTTGSTSSASSLTTSSTAPSTSLTAPPQRDIPPIITYPEFLIHSSKPPPLITARRLLNTAYFAAGASALVYGASKYLVGPMTDSLNAARHDLAHHTQEQLSRLNSALGDIVSIDPAGVNGLANRRAITGTGAGEDEEDASDVDNDDSEDSDPTELFHRDFGTQTADLPTTPNSSSSSSTAALDNLAEASSRSSEAQLRQLKRLRELCDELASDERSESDSHREIGSSLQKIDEQLQSISLPAGLYSSHSSSRAGGSELPNSRYQRRAEDVFGKTKIEIRGVKGVLLSAKHFPGGIGAAGGTSSRVNAAS